MHGLVHVAALRAHVQISLAKVATSNGLLAHIVHLRLLLHEVVFRVLLLMHHLLQLMFAGKSFEFYILINLMCKTRTMFTFSI